jgi:hypothetical protein
MLLHHQWWWPFQQTLKAQSWIFEMIASFPSNSDSQDKTSDK